MEKNRDKLLSSAVYIYDSTLKAVGCDRNAYHKQSIDGNKGRKLMEKREEFGFLLWDSMKEALANSKLEREEILKKHPGSVNLKLATEEELQEKVTFFIQTLHLLNCVLPPIRKVRALPLSDEEIDNISINILKLKAHWCVKRPWEEKTISVTPKWHVLFTHVIPRLKKFRRICHFAEDPIERTHASDKHLSSQFKNRRNKVQHEETKRKAIKIKRHSQVAKEVDQHRSKKARTFAPKTEDRRNQLAETKAVIKLESRDSDKTFSL